MQEQYASKLSLGKVIDQGIQLGRKSFKSVFPLFLLPSIFTSVPSFITNAAEMFGLAPLNQNPSMMLFIASLTLAGYAAYLFLGVAATRNIYLQTKGQQLNTTESIKLFTTRDLWLIWTAFVWVLAIFVGFLVVIIPGIYLSVIFSVGLTLAIIEQTHGVACIRRTFDLTRFYWWKTFLLILLVTLISSVLSGIFYMPIALLTFMGQSSGMMGISLILLALIYSVWAAALVPFYQSIVITYYNTLRSVKESSDIEADLDTLSADTPAS